MQDKLRATAAEFLKREEAICFIGWEEAPGDDVTRPVFIRKPGQSKRLVWNDRCHPNPATYLPRFRGRDGIVGIAVKGCDARSVRELIRSNQAARERLFIVGVPCTGLRDTAGNLSARCSGCRFPEDFEYDVTLGPMVSPNLDIENQQTPIEQMTPEERRAFWQDELSKCIRCDACRKICYGCFCPQCIFEATDPKWISGRKDLAEKFFYHAVRAYHLAGRCISCNECSRACPSGVRLDLLNQAMRNCAAETFQFGGAGVTADDPPLRTFRVDDPDPFSEGGQ